MQCDSKLLDWTVSAGQVKEPHSPSSKPSAFDRMLTESVDDVLADLLGDRVRDQLYDYLATHYSYGREEIPQKTHDFFAFLENTFASGGSTVGTTIIRRLSDRLGYECVSVPAFEYKEELGALRTEVDGLTQGNIQIKQEDETLTLRKHTKRTEILERSPEKQRTERELATLAQGATIAKTETNRLQRATRALNSDIEKLNRIRSDADRAAKALQKQVNDLTARVDVLEREGNILSSSILDLTAKKDATQTEVDELRAERVRLLGIIKKDRTIVEGLTDELFDLSSSRDEHLYAARKAHKARQGAEGAPINSRIKVTLLILAVVGASLLAGASLHASNQSDPTTVTETYLSVTTSKLTVSSQFTVTSPQFDVMTSALLMPVFGRWITSFFSSQRDTNL